MRSFLHAYQGIKTLRVQGAHHVALAAVKALRYARGPSDVAKLLSVRPTEPCLRNALWCAQNYGEQVALDHLLSAHQKMLLHAKFLFAQKKVVYTHCHSSAVMDILAFYKKKVYHVVHTETRPLFQGRLVAQDLSRLHIPHTMYVDSAMRQAIKQASVVLLGCDAISSTGIYNKIGSELVCVVAKEYGIPVYICTDSWKFDVQSKSSETVIEERPASEVWARPSSGTVIANPAFEKINPALVTGIVSELGVHTPKQFLREVQKAYPWMK